MFRLWLILFVAAIKFIGLIEGIILHYASAMTR